MPKSTLQAVVCYVVCNVSGRWFRESRDMLINTEHGMHPNAWSNSRWEDEILSAFFKEPERLEDDVAYLFYVGHSEIQDGE